MNLALLAALGIASLGAYLFLRRPRGAARLATPAPVPPAAEGDADPLAGMGAEDPDAGTSARFDPDPSDLSRLPTVDALEPHFPGGEALLLGEEPAEMTLLAIQIDGLDSVQESLGDIARARAVLEVAHAVRGSLRQGDTCARWEKDRLVAMLPGIGGSAAPGVASRVHSAVGSLTLVTHGGREIQLGVSIGAASSPAGGGTFPELLGTARRDLERVRAHLVPAPEMDRPAEERIRAAVPLVSN